MVDVFHAVPELQDEMPLVVQVGLFDIVFVKPGIYLCHKVVQAAGFHWYSSCQVGLDKVNSRKFSINEVPGNTVLPGIIIIP
jgi:hypothetical protein